jgi:hypothetical protein
MLCLASTTDDPAPSAATFARDACLAHLLPESVPSLRPHHTGVTDTRGLQDCRLAQQHRTEANVQTQRDQHAMDQLIAHLEAHDLTRLGSIAHSRMEMTASSLARARIFRTLYPSWWCVPGTSLSPILGRSPRSVVSCSSIYATHAPLALRARAVARSRWSGNGQPVRIPPRAGYSK